MEPITPDSLRVKTVCRPDGAVEIRGDLSHLGKRDQQHLVLVVGTDRSLRLWWNTRECYTFNARFFALRGRKRPGRQWEAPTDALVRDQWHPVLLEKFPIPFATRYSRKHHGLDGAQLLEAAARKQRSLQAQQHAKRLKPALKVGRRVWNAMWRRALPLLHQDYWRLANSVAGDCPVTLYNRLCTDPQRAQRLQHCWPVVSLLEERPAAFPDLAWCDDRDTAVEYLARCATGCAPTPAYRHWLQTTRPNPRVCPAKGKVLWELTKNMGTVLQQVDADLGAHHADVRFAVHALARRGHVAIAVTLLRESDPLAAARALLAAARVQLRRSERLWDVAQEVERAFRTGHAAPTQSMQDQLDGLEALRRGAPPRFQPPYLQPEDDWSLI